MTEEDFNTALDKAIPPSVPPVEPLMQFFDAQPEPKEDHNTSVIRKSFMTMASDIVFRLPRNPERTVALRKLLEARDCAMRAAVMK